MLANLKMLHFFFKLPCEVGVRFSVFKNEKKKIPQFKQKKVYSVFPFKGRSSMQCHKQQNCLNASWCLSMDRGRVTAAAYLKRSSNSFSQQIHFLHHIIQHGLPGLGVLRENMQGSTLSTTPHISSAWPKFYHLLYCHDKAVLQQWQTRAA